MEDCLKIWSIQPKEVINEIHNNGFVVCDPVKIGDWFGNEYDKFKPAYDWLVKRMSEKIGKPDHVRYPLWGWYIRDWRNKKPDLRNIGYGRPGDIQYCIECEIPVKEIVLTDFQEWNCVLNDFPLFVVDSDEEYERIYDKFSNLSTEEQEKYKRDSWNQVFDIAPFNNGYRIKGKYVQATFWELRKEYIKKVTKFKVR